MFTVALIIYKVSPDFVLVITYKQGRLSYTSPTKKVLIKFYRGGISQIKKPGRQHSENMKKSFFYLIIFPAFFLLCGNTVHAGKWIAAGGYHTVARYSGGVVSSWGYNSNGQLGDGTQIDNSTPVQVSGLSDVMAIAAGWQHTVALKQDGTVWAWGYNSNGQLGDGTQIDNSTPVQVSGLSSVTAIAAGDYHTVALKEDGTVWAWGDNCDGQLGNGTQIDNSTPVQGLSGVTAIAAGGFHTVALKQDGTVWAWGNNDYGQLGDGTQTYSPTPVQVSGLSNVTAIAAGDYHTVALKQDGTVWAWGWNYAGQLGDGTWTDSPTPVQVNGLSTNVTAIAAGGYHTVALKQDGTVWAWGLNGNGQLGDGTQTYSPTPVQASGLYNVTAIVAGDAHTVALKQDGTVWAWGWNYAGQLGNGTTTDSSTPVYSNIGLFLCTYSFSPSNYGYSDQGGSGSINVNPSAGSCNWTATSSDPWISVTSGSSGTGIGTVAYNVSPNTTGSGRMGKISIGNQDIFILQAPSTFVDYPNDLFTPNIYAIYTKGITKGCNGSPNYFCPGDPVTQGQMAVFIIRAIYGENFSYTTTPYFSDVPATYGAFKYIQKMKDTGITKVEGTYMVDDIVTRGAMAAFIIRAKYGEDFNYTQTPYFTDVPASNGYFKYIQKMKDDGITGNVGTYNWTDVVIREHMAAFLARAFLGMQ